MIEEPSPDYFAYLVRFWRSGPGQPWRVSLEDPHTGEQRGFGSLEALLVFLKRRMRQPSQSNHKCSQSEEGG